MKWLDTIGDAALNGNGIFNTVSTVMHVRNEVQNAISTGKKILFVVIACAVAFLLFGGKRR